ncbi:Hypothetical protein Bdt_0931 [Bdellovibrio bacteriovorus str. Tiberius]|uniref:Uncharacterized protein n=1 Tax=Bdellovibrio bacteriovorus str. Tiberius TaxID=1069642 RepID=K7YLI3_BDEBC|nr:Hypothetical protein Bdt_0931 [Bdellovibrio bacteriovorus str. Tiberius]
MIFKLQSPVETPGFFYFPAPTFIRKNLTSLLFVPKRDS